MIQSPSKSKLPVDIKTYFKQKAVSVDVWLDRLLPAESDNPSIIHQAMRYSTFAGGKRLRPILMIAVGEVFGATEQELMPAACALEMIHTYSLIHDDLPAMDNDDLRRGMPTCHVKFGEAMAILAGDALLTQAFVALADYETSHHERKARVVKEVAHAAATSNALIGGQVLDMQFEGKSVTGPQLEEIHRGKTGALIRCAVRIGAILGGATDTELSALTVYGERAGLAFQVADDLLDETATSEELGKTAGKDAASHKATYTALYGIEGARQMADRLCLEAVTAIRSLDRKTETLEAIAHFIVERKS
ncbi:MAG TPA: polyprenyl synthetase family protein [Blastocatellia bacterium]|nr:polyprenyl synthetase family protein [Blastocatellia bacterium]